MTCRRPWRWRTAPSCSPPIRAASPPTPRSRWPRTSGGRARRPSPPRSRGSRGSMPGSPGRREPDGPGTTAKPRREDQIMSTDHEDQAAWARDAYAEDYTRRQTLDMLARGGLFASLAGLLSGLPARSFAQEDEVVRIGYIPITDATALLVAHANGYFEDEGLAVEQPTLIRGWSPLVEGFVSNKFNLV